jgi:FAD/FMN-containing dehydrogenase/Fe-S oxidoreductase
LKTTLKEHQKRFQRLAADDSRTAIPSSAVHELETLLKRKLDGEVRFDKGTRALYSTDGSNYRQAPIGVVIPRHTGDVETTVELARRFEAPILSRGGGTSLAGQCCNVAIVMDFSKYMRRVLEIDPRKRLARVEPGCILDDLRNAAIQQYGLTFAPDPETHSHCTLGGMLGNNSCGVHSLMARNNGMGMRCSDNCHQLDVLTYEGHRLEVGQTSDSELDHLVHGGGPRGDIYRNLRELRDRYATTIRRRFPKLDRRVSGYNIDELLPENRFNVARSLVGTESTCVTIMEASLHLVPEPQSRSLLILGYPDIYSAADHLQEILEFNPIGLEGIDEYLFRFVKQKGDESANLALLPPGNGFLLVEFGGDSKQDANDRARQLIEKLRLQPGAPETRIYDDPTQEKMIWQVRKGALASTAWVPGMPDTWEGWEDSAVPVPKIAEYLREFRKILDRYNYRVTLYGHFGQGCVHTRIPFDLYSSEGIRTWERFIDEATDLVLRFGGSFSGEHGDGQSRGQWLHKMYGPELLEAFERFKRIWDPQWKMNPGKIIRPYRMTENLRLGPDYKPDAPESHFQFPDDKHSFARAALRCVGVGECRREGGGTMCPSYMVTREEMHSTRGRSRLLFEMMNGEILAGEPGNDAVKHALDLCLACKGCKAECPVNVDMATYKAEFLSHYYESHFRPRHAFAFGWIHTWLRLASVSPPLTALTNVLTRAPVLRSLAGWVAGVDPRRSIPVLAPKTFLHWFRGRRNTRRVGNPVMLWPDTFNNHFHPETAKAAVEVLEAAGFKVHVPDVDVCCGRPLYDYGFLDMAKRQLESTIVAMKPYIHTGIPIIVLEPSCWAVFKDELTNLLADNPDAKHLQKLVFSLGDFLNSHAAHFPFPALNHSALLHGHCHQKALDRQKDKPGILTAEQNLLKQMDVTYAIPETGCCGMAGAFGFERGEHYDVSVACAERALIPEIEKSGNDAWIIADGFSCREQIAQTTHRRAMHMAEVLQMSVRREASHADAIEIQTHHAGHRPGWRAAFIAAGIAAVVIGLPLTARFLRLRR